jgi:hypothetical protein
MDTNTLVLSALTLGFIMGFFLRGRSINDKLEQIHADRLQNKLYNCQALVGLWMVGSDPVTQRLLKSASIEEAIDECGNQLNHVLETGELPE